MTTHARSVRRLTDIALLQRVFDLQRRRDHLTLARLNRWATAHMETDERGLQETLPDMETIEIDLAELRASAHALKVSLREINREVARRGGLPAIHRRIAEQLEELEPHA